MRTVLKLSVVLLLLVVLIAPIAPGAHAAPQAVCVSNATGNWNTAGTWSCGSVPTASDIVIINDGHTVTLDVNGLAAQLIVGGGASGVLSDDGNSRTLTVGTGGLTISNGGTLNAGTATIRVAGNATLGSGFSAGTSTLELNGGGGQSLNTGSALYLLTINKATGTASMVSDATVDAVVLTLGDLNVGSNMLTLASVGSAGGDLIGNVRRNGPFSTGVNYTFNHPSTLINFSSVTSDGTSSITVNLVKSAPGGLLQAIARTYSITPVNLSGINADLQLRYNGTTELGSLVEANLRPWKQIGGRWTLQAGSVNLVGDFVSATGVSSFSPWAISDSGAPTAVTLSTFAPNDPAQSNFVMPMLGLLGVVIAGGAWFARRARQK